MKALIVSPYFGKLGGGERYMLTLAKSLERLSYEIYLTATEIEVARLEQFLNIKLKSPHFAPQLLALYARRNPLATLLATRDYDLVFYLSDGSIPLLGGRRNYLHFQIPHQGTSGKSIANKIKLSRIQKIIVNSNFTKQYIDEEYGVDATVIYPPVQLGSVATNKSKIILTVGRFEKSKNIKKQNVLIRTFNENAQKLKDWEFVLIGGSSDNEWVSNLRSKAHKRIKIITELSDKELKEYYRRATFYWHGAGYGESELDNPAQSEHFGITTVEALSYGCIPLVYPAGGQKEIIKDNYFYWTSLNELVAKTNSMAKDLQSAQRRARRIDIQQFSEKVFINHIQQLVHE